MKHFQSIESLRAWMAWWVVVGHALHLSGWTFLYFDTGPLHYVLRLVERGSTAVNTFIIVSGFVITHLIMTRQETYRSYILRRWLRIFPIFLFALMLALLLYPLYLEAYTNFPWVYAREMRIDRAAQEMANFPAHLLLHLTMLHGIIPEEILRYSSGAFLAPAWSLSLEWQFYLIAPALIMIFAQGKLWQKVVLAAVFFMLILAVRVQDTYSWNYPSMLFLALPHFFVGIGCRLAIEGRRPLRLFGTGLALFSLPFTDYLAIIIWGFFFLILLYENGTIRLPTPMMPLVRLTVLNRRTAYLGKLSYSTYLLHIPIFSLIVGGCSVLSGGQMSQGAVTGLLLLSMLLMVPVSAIAYRWIEKPFIRWGNRRVAIVRPVKLG